MSRDRRGNGIQEVVSSILIGSTKSFTFASARSPLRRLFLVQSPELPRADSELLSKGVIEVRDVAEADVVADLGDAAVGTDQQAGGLGHAAAAQQVANGRARDRLEQVLQARGAEVHRRGQLAHRERFLPLIRDPEEDLLYASVHTEGVT